MEDINIDDDFSIVNTSSQSIMIENCSILFKITGRGTSFLANSTTVEIKDSVIHAEADHYENGFLLQCNATIEGS